MCQWPRDAEEWECGLGHCWFAWNRFESSAGSYQWPTSKSGPTISPQSTEQPNTPLSRHYASVEMLFWIDFWYWISSYNASTNGEWYGPSCAVELCVWNLISFVAAHSISLRFAIGAHDMAVCIVHRTCKWDSHAISHLNLSRSSWQVLKCWRGSCKFTVISFVLHTFFSVSNPHSTRASSSLHFLSFLHLTIFVVLR